MTIKEKSVFCAVIEKFRNQYPEIKINIIGGNNGEEFLTINDKIRFNTTGYNLLDNLKRLCDELKD